MGMSTHVIGFRPPDERWHQMKSAYDALKKAGLEIPDEIGRFFDWESPDPSGQEVKLKKGDHYSEWNEDSRSGYEIDIRKLPPETHIIRVYNAW